MNRSLKTSPRPAVLALLGMAALTSSALAQAPRVGSIVQPANVTTSYTQVFAGVGRIASTFDQSGLNAAYISGQTNFNAYLASTVHDNANASMMLVNSNGLNQPEGDVQPGGTITLDLGQVLPIDAVGYWATRIAPELSSRVAVRTDNDADISNGGDTLLGTYNVAATSDGTALEFPRVETRFVHLVVLEHGGGSFLRAGEFSVRVAGEASVFRTSGADAASILPTVDAFRADLGDLNRPDPGSRVNGRREINWDGAPDQFVTPNAFPGNFFNAPAFPRARGAEFSTPGTELQVSATLESNIGIEFGNLAPGLENEFEAFSRQRLFTSLGSTVTVVDFFVPGTSVPATCRGFGSIFTDVDTLGSTTIELFDAQGRSLGVWTAPQGPTADQSFSFLGISFDEPVVARAEITSGSRVLTDLEGSGDRVAMDDFIYGEPVCPADFNRDGQADFFDYLDFAQAFSAEDPASDFNRDGQADFYDYLDFANAFSIGCG